MGFHEGDRVRLKSNHSIVGTITHIQRRFQGYNVLWITVRLDSGKSGVLFGTHIEKIPLDSLSPV